MAHRPSPAQDPRDHKIAVLESELGGLKQRIKALEGVERERRRVDSLLRASEERLRILADFAYDWELWIGPDGGMLYVSPSCQRVSGYPAAAFLADPHLLERCIHQDDLPNWRQLLAAGTCTVNDQDVRFLRRQGGLVWLAGRSQCVTDGQGRPRGMRVSLRDVTWRKESEAALREAEVKFRSIVDQAPVGIFQATPDGRYLSVNQAMATMYGYPDPASMIAAIHDFATEIFVEPGLAEGILETLRRHGEVHECEAEVRRRDGNTIWTSRNVRARRDDTGELLWFDGFVVDISERKAAEQLRADVERIVRHDLKNPLLGVVAGAEMLLRRDMGARERELAGLIVEQGRKALRLAQASLDYYRMEQGTYGLTPAPVELGSLLNHVELELHHLLAARTVRLARRLHGGAWPVGAVCPVHGEVYHLETMLANLVRNAVEAAPEGSTVTVAVDQRPPWLRIDIHNLGVVPAEIRHRFFEPYATSGKAFGTGLGTSSARLIAQAHGGDITFTTSSREGTHLLVQLPLPREERPPR